MFLKRNSLNLTNSILLSLGLLLPYAATATEVIMQTSLGNIDIQLDDAAAPATVANFLSYVDSGAYNGSVFHRSVPGFILQGGGFTVDNNGYPLAIPTNAPVVNEYGLPNVTGTIAMAKLNGNANSATDQWFFNLVDNTSTLGPANNGGFSVFGQVTSSSMAVINSIAGLSTYNESGNFINAGVSANVAGAFTNLPLQSDGSGNLYYVTVNDVFVVAPLPGAIWFYAPAVLGWVSLMRRSAGKSISQVA